MAYQGFQAQTYGRRIRCCAASHLRLFEEIVIDVEGFLHTSNSAITVWLLKLDSAVSSGPAGARQGPSLPRRASEQPQAKNHHAIALRRLTAEELAMKYAPFDHQPPRQKDLVFEAREVAPLAQVDGGRAPCLGIAGKSSPTARTNLVL